MSDARLYRQEGARSAEQREIMARDGATDTCSFCELAPDREVTVFSDHWLLTPNAFPIPYTDVSLLLIPRYHVVTFGWLPIECVQELGVWLAKVERIYNLAAVDYSLVSRVGKAGRFNARTVGHLHFQINSSDRRRARIEDVEVEIRRSVQEVYELICQDDPELADRVRIGLDVYRAALLGKARPIRVKLSDAADHD